ncbi:tetratricopeptide (TPR) repeat protein [Azospirillum sp. OGB3]|uniref:DUF4062 domain-containing protein n=1 Tax=Azospirillum sp. OGB3 TaxID=2587012 RepID=UPI001606C99C|nr:DUF4062 domain-containing protein [Azospirillum sp. OGB3]MBB3262929.1 tetratricopeptide (TPR) repeat protein [Azospirillum sp. OGB3]
MAASSRKFQFFVSSVYEGLQEERRAVFDAIIDGGNFPIGMESFVATNEAQFQFIKKQIDQADCFVVILATRYGEIDSTTKKSYTEMEFDYALESGKEIIAFIIREDVRDDWARKKSEYLDIPIAKISDNSTALNAFRARLSQGRMVKFWSNSDELRYICGASAAHFTQYAASSLGWVPASFSNQFQDMSEQLREQVKKLREVLIEKDVEIKGLEENLEVVKLDLASSRRIDELVSGRDFIEAIERSFANLLSAPDSTRLAREADFKKALLTFTDMLGDGTREAIAISSDEIEQVGDICRESGYREHAYRLYERAVRRNPKNISAEIELRCLEMDIFPSRRDEVFQQLVELGDKCSESQIKRIFNALIEVSSYDRLYSFCTSILERRGPSLTPKLQALILRNRAIGCRHLEGFGIAEEAFRDIERAMTLDGDEENNIKIYATFLRDANRLEEASKQFAVLIRMDPKDATYYMGLAQCLRARRRNEHALMILDKALELVPLQDQPKILRFREDFVAPPQAKEVSELLAAIEL